MLLEKKVPDVPMVDEEGAFVGFVTALRLLVSTLPKHLTTLKDVSFLSEAGDVWVDYFAGTAERPVGEVISKEVSHVELGTSEVIVAHKMVHEGVSCVVITAKGRVASIVNRLDLYAAIIEVKPA